MNDNEITLVSQNVSTPSYVFDAVEFENRVSRIKSTLGDGINICFSIKANPFLVDDVFGGKLLFDKIEVCSLGELHICKKCLVPPEKIFFSGVNKSLNDIEEAFLYGVRMFTVESYNHIKYINLVGKKYQCVIPVFIRISAETQFGMDESDVINIIKNRDIYSDVDIIGIHYFTGTQKKKTSIIYKEIKYIEEFCIKVHDELDFKIRNIEYGTGLFFNYFHEQFEESDNLLAEIAEPIRNLSRISKVTIEMGRYFAASCGYYFTRIIDCKKNNNAFYAIVDGGMNQLHYDGQLKSMKTPFFSHLSMEEINYKTQKEKWIICGSICSTEDVIMRNVEFNNLKENDLIVFHNTGAYSFMEGMSTFLSREMPQIWAYTKDKKLILMRNFIFTDCFNCKQENV